MVHSSPAIARDLGIKVRHDPDERCRVFPASDVAHRGIPSEKHTHEEI